MLKLCFSVIFILAVIKEVCTCPNHWVRFDSSCFAIIESQNTWADASIICEQMGGYLAEIDSEMKAVFIKAIVKDNHSLSPLVWIGGNDLIFEGNWVWTKSNLPINYTNWCHDLDQPNNQQNQDCLAMGSNCEWKWYDEACQRQFSSLCEMNPLVWIGGNDLIFEGNWVWTKSNLPINYTNWCHDLDQPNNQQNQDCLAMGSNCEWKWYDEACQRQFSSLCEMKAPSMTLIG